MDEKKERKKLCPRQAGQQFKNDEKRGGKCDDLYRDELLCTSYQKRLRLLQMRNQGQGRGRAQATVKWDSGHARKYQHVHRIGLTQRRTG